MDFSTRYAKLNNAQKTAVDTIEGPVMVIAGPGTGKTELLSMRAANILRKTDTLPENILCLTFTESGASAMRERLLQIIGPAAYKVAIHTFHSFGMEIMNQHGQFFYHGSDFRPADELTSYEILTQIFDELEYDNPLASKMNDEYTHLPDTLQTISELKRSGLTSDELLAILDANEQVIDHTEPKLADIFASRLNKTTPDILGSLLPEIRKITTPMSIPGIPSLAAVLADTLEEAIESTRESSTTKPIQAWRSAWMTKDDEGRFILKARKAAIKLRSTSYIYYQYLLRMQQAKLYDFDDMILRIVHAMEVFPELRFNLQEHYHYLMIDEFQDTNLAQMRILYNLTANEANADSPNILVVGDDDQAIYSFQGADVGNIHGFLHLFPATTRIVLTDNYRSTAPILEHARAIITLGQNRLESIMPELDKTLTAHLASTETTVRLSEITTIDEERAWIANDIATKIKQGTSPESIAILARRHRELEALLPYLFDAKVPVSYERQHNVLELDPIRLLEQLATLLVRLFENQYDEADSLLPELLAHPAFGIPPLKIWQLSLTAKQAHKSWLETMSTLPDFIDLHEWLITSSQLLSHTPLEIMIDTIIGTNQETEGRYISPIAHYYFSTETLQENPETYLTYLEALRTIRSRLIEHQPAEVPTLQTMLEFIRLHRERGSTVMSIHSTSTAREAVHVMTAHKSKGLEFDHVYILGAIDSSWGERVRTRSRLISYPQNLPLAPAGDTYDERLRLFFVAATRAKKHLTITYSLTNDIGKPTLAASFLATSPWKPLAIESKNDISQRVQLAELAWYQPLLAPIEPSMKELLLPTLQSYKLSATHVTTFIDIVYGGPEAVLINHLLRFPYARSAQAGYGSAIHAALQRAHSHLAATGNLRPHEDILHDYEEALRAQSLSIKDFQTYLAKGSAVLSTYLEAKYDTFSPTQKAELNFAGQSVFIGDAHLTGVLDVVDFNDGMLTITDYKTGKPSRSWQGKDEYEKIKLHRYKQQLMFYQLLVNHSRSYAKYSVDKVALEFVEASPQNEIIRLEAHFSSDDLEQFAQLIQIIWKRITTLDFPDTEAYEKSYQGICLFEDDLLNQRI